MASSPNLSSAMRANSKAVSDISAPLSRLLPIIKNDYAMGAVVIQTLGRRHYFLVRYISTLLATVSL